VDAERPAKRRRTSPSLSARDETGMTGVLEDVLLLVLLERETGRSFDDEAEEVVRGAIVPSFARRAAKKAFVL
jgi:hypothetical protein